MNKTEDEDPYEEAAVYHTVIIEKVIKVLKDSGIRFELDIQDEDLGIQCKSRRGTSSEGPKVLVYVHKDDMEKFQAAQKVLFP